MTRRAELGAAEYRRCAEDEAPGAVGWHAQDFGVHQVTEPNKSTGHEAWSGQRSSSGTNGVSLTRFLKR